MDNKQQLVDDILELKSYLADEGNWCKEREFDVKDGRVYALGSNRQRELHHRGEDFNNRRG